MSTRDSGGESIVALVREEDDEKEISTTNQSQECLTVRCIINTNVVKVPGARSVQGEIGPTGVEKSKPYSDVDEPQIGALQQIKSSSSQTRVPTRRFAAAFEAGDNVQNYQCAGLSSYANQSHFPAPLADPRMDRPARPH